MQAIELAIKASEMVQAGEIRFAVEGDIHRIKLGTCRFIRHPFDARGPRPVQVIDYAEGVDSGLRRYDNKFELFRVSPD